MIRPDSNLDELWEDFRSDVLADSGLSEMETKIVFYGGMASIVILIRMGATPEHIVKIFQQMDEFMGQTQETRDILSERDRHLVSSLFRGTK